MTRQRRPNTSGPDEAVEEVCGLTQARAASGRAAVERDRTVKRGEEIKQVADSIREIRRRNHFGEILTNALKGK